MREVITADGRTLAVEEWGEPTGTAVIYLHGTPVSRLARYPDDRLFGRLGVRLITNDRPGYGRSTPRPGRRVVDAADGVRATTYRLSAYVNGSYVFLGASGTGTSDPSTWTPGTGGTFAPLSVSFATGAGTTSVTVYLHGWYGQPSYHADDVALV